MYILQHLDHMFLFLRGQETFPISLTRASDSMQPPILHHFPTSTPLCLNETGPFLKVVFQSPYLTAKTIIFNELLPLIMKPISRALNYHYPYFCPDRKDSVLNRIQMSQLEPAEKPNASKHYQFVVSPWVNSIMSLKISE